MPPAASSPTSSRVTESMLGMSPGEVRLLLLGHLCSDKKTGKVDIDKLATRASITVPSARNMYRAALSKLARLNPEPNPDQGDDAGPSTSGALPCVTPSRRGRRGGRPPGRPREKKASDADTTAEAVTNKPEEGEPKNDDQAKVDESEVEMKDRNEETGIGEDEM